MSKDLVVAAVDGSIATVTLDDPPMNPVSGRTLDALHKALDTVEKAKGVRCVIFTGAGEKAFCAGGDLRQESEFKDASDGKRFREYGRRTLNRLETFPKPIVAAIHG